LRRILQLGRGTVKGAVKIDAAEPVRHGENVQSTARGKPGEVLRTAKKNLKRRCGEIAGFLVPTWLGTRNALMVLQIIDPARGGTVWQLAIAAICRRLCCY